MITKSTLRQLLCATPIFLSSFLYGCNKGCIPLIAKNMMMTWNISSQIGLGFSAGSYFSILISYLIGVKFGRKTLLIYCTLTNVIFWLSDPNDSAKTVTIAGYFFYGISSGMLSIIGTIYIGEIADPQNREVCGIISMYSSEIGMLVALFKNYSDRLLVVFSLVTSIIALVLYSLFMVESPYYLVENDNVTEAKTNLGWLNDTLTDEEISTKVNSMEDYINASRSRRAANIKIIFGRENLKLLLSMVFITSAACFNVYSLVCHAELVILLSMMSSNIYMNIFIGSIFLAVILSLIFIRSFNRRGLLISEFILISVIELCWAFRLHYDRNHTNGEFKCKLLIVSSASIVFIMVSSSIQMLKTEIFPHKCKLYYIGTLILVSDLAYLSALVLVKFVYIYIAVNILMNIGAAFVIYLFLSETKNKELYQIRNTLSNCNKT